MSLRIKEVCKEKGITVLQLAEKIGTTKQALYAVIEGNPSIGKLQSIADALGVPVTELLEAPSDGSLSCPHCGKKIPINLG